MLATVCSATLQGAEAQPVVVEVHVSNGLPGFTIVGLPDAACREARDRVRAALLSSGCTWPMRRVTVNLAPSSLPKAGAGLDLAMALGLLAALGALDARLLEGCAFFGELGLDGSLRPVPGTLALVSAVAPASVVVPPAVLTEARLAGEGRVRCVRSLRELLDALSGQIPWPELAVSASSAPAIDKPVDLAAVRGQAIARRALEIAAAGGHHLLLVGPPGAGKTLLARALPGLLPPLSRAEALEAGRIRSAAGLPVPGPEALSRPPFRAPHFGASAVTLFGGGGTWCRPGEVSLASSGVLFLDELGELAVPILEALREPLEEGMVRLARARLSVTLPARFLLVAAANPCPCGAGTAPGRCRCSPAVRQRYARRLSAPLLDRLDLQVVMEPPSPEELLGDYPPAESSACVARRVAAVRRLARRRGVRCSAELSPEQLDAVAPLAPGAREVLAGRIADGSLTGRSLVRVRQVARTIADLDGADGPIQESHVAEALSLRAGREALLVPGLGNG